MTLPYRRAGGRVVTALLAAGILFGCGTQTLRALGGEPEPDRLNGRFVRKLAFDFGKVVASPAHWSRRDALGFAALAGTAALFYAYDQDLRDWVQDRRTESSDDVFSVLTEFGNGAYVCGFIALLYAGGEAFDSPGVRRTALLSFEGWAVSGLIVQGMKVLFGRARPDLDEGSRSWKPLAIRTSHLSFPSGHSATAFAVATIIAGEADSVFVDAAVYGLASLVAISRVYLNKHWASDIVAGSAIGFFVGRAIRSLNKPADEGKPVIRAAPTANGFAVSVCF